jgi:ABC-type transport system involved in multi-copper enzyme maturation permease subunit
MTSLAAEIPFPGRRRPELVLGELLKLRKRRGLVVTTALLTVGAAVFTYALLAILHSANPAHYGPAGGVAKLGHSLFLLSLLGGVTAAIAGATAGAGDLNAGVFRELVVTGRSRLALFAARIPGGFAFLLPFAAVAFTVAAVASVVFADSLAPPSMSLLVSSGLWLLLTMAFAYLVGLGLASLLGSRAQTIGIFLAWQLAVTPILLSIKVFGVGREFLPGAALQQLEPAALQGYMRQGTPLHMSTAATAATLTLWALVALALGAWRTATRDA